MADDTTLGNASATNQVPPINPNPATSAPAAPDVTPATPAAVPALPGGAPAAAPPVPTAGTNFGSNGETPHGTIGKVFQAIAGGQTTDYVQTDKGPVPVKRDLKPGELSRNILASAMSLISAGTGGALAAKEKRPYQQIGPTLGEINNSGPEAREQAAQQVFKNTQEANAFTLQAQKDAREQQESIARMQNYADAHVASVQARDAGSRANEEKDFENLAKHTVEYNQALAMPGSELMKGPDGKVLSFSSAADMAAWGAAHPDAIHGTQNGTAMFGVVPVKNPATGQYQIVDYPADRHTVGLEMVGAKRGPDGEVIMKDGEPVPDGSVLDPNTHKPTVLTQRVTPDQARAIKAQNITQANTIALMNDREAQEEQRRAAIKKDDDVRIGLDLYDQGKIEKMTDPQLKAARNYAHQQVTVLSNREIQAGKTLQKAQSAAAAQGKSDDDVAKDPTVVKAQADYDDAKSDYNDASTMSDRLGGRTPETKTGERILQGSKNIVADWTNGAVDKAITSSGLSEESQQQVKNFMWNRLSATQKASIQNQNKAAAAPAQNQTEKATILDPQGKPHLVDKNLKDQYLASPQYKGWTDGGK